MTSPAVCPACGVPRTLSIRSCSACGISFVDVPEMPSHPSPVNPYAAPAADLSAPKAGLRNSGGIWRSGKFLVMLKDAVLPDRCVRCGVPSSRRIDRTLYWHPPAWYFLIIFPGVLIYAIVALIIRKKAKLSVPVCEAHAQKRTRLIAMAWVLGLAGVGAGIAGMAAIDDWGGIGCLGGVLVFLISLVFGSSAANIVTPKRIDETRIWLRKVDPAFLASLPTEPGSAG